MVALAVGYGFYLRFVDFAPGALWLDDVWVAELSRAPTIRDFFLYGSSSPPLFNAIVALCIRTLPGPEASAQFFPFVCALLAIPATAVAAWLVTDRPWAGAIAAIIVACHPVAIEYAARVKQYSSDMVVAAGYGTGFCLLLRYANARWLWGCTLAAAIGLPLSTSSLFLAAAFFPVAVIGLARRGVAAKHLAGASLCMAVAVALIWFGVIRPGTNAALREFWAPFYLPADSTSAFLDAARAVTSGWIAQCLHATSAGQRDAWIVAGGAAFVALGAMVLVIAPERRSYVAANLVLLAALLVASASRRFPLGAGRVELFVMPLVAILLAAGVVSVGRLQSRVVRILWIAAVCSFVVFKMPAPRVARYPVEVSSPLIATLAREKTADDAVVINVHGTFAVGYYGPWPSTFVPDPTLGTGFHVMPVTPRTYVVGETNEEIRSTVATIVNGNPRRILYFATHAPGTLSRKVTGFLAVFGWKPTRREQAGGAELTVYGTEPR